MKIKKALRNILRNWLNPTGRCSSGLLRKASLGYLLICKVSVLPLTYPYRISGKPGFLQTWKPTNFPGGNFFDHEKENVYKGFPKSYSGGGTMNKK